MVSFPRPAFPKRVLDCTCGECVHVPPVTIITLPLRSGMSVSGSNFSARPRG